MSGKNWLGFAAASAGLTKLAGSIPSAGGAACPRASAAAKNVMTSTIASTLVKSRFLFTATLPRLLILILHYLLERLFRTQLPVRYESKRLTLASGKTIDPSMLVEA